MPPAEVLVIVPTYNERDNLPGIVAAVHEHLPEARRCSFVDDNSPDGTGAARRRDRGAATPQVHVLHRAGKLGLAPPTSPASSGRCARGYEFLFEMDCRLLATTRSTCRSCSSCARDGADLVLGSRYVAGGGTVNWGPMRKLISRGGSLYARTILGVGVRDLTGGFKCFRRAALEALDLDSVSAQGYGFQIEMTYRAVKRGLARRGGADHLRRPPRRPVEDVARRSSSRR